MRELHLNTMIFEYIEVLVSSAVELASSHLIRATNIDLSFAQAHSVRYELCSFLLFICHLNLLDVYQYFLRTILL